MKLIKFQVKDDAYHSYHAYSYSSVFSAQDQKNLIPTDATNKWPQCLFKLHCNHRLLFGISIHNSKSWSLYLTYPAFLLPWKALGGRGRDYGPVGSTMTQIPGLLNSRSWYCSGRGVSSAQLISNQEPKSLKTAEVLERIAQGRR